MELADAIVSGILVAHRQYFGTRRPSLLAFFHPEEERRRSLTKLTSLSAESAAAKTKGELIILVTVILAEDSFHQLLCHIINYPLGTSMVIIPANLTSSAIFIRQGNDPCLSVHGAEPELPETCDFKIISSSSLLSWKLFFCHCVSAACGWVMA